MEKLLSLESMARFILLATCNSIRTSITFYFGLDYKRLAATGISLWLLKECQAFVAIALTPWDCGVPYPPIVTYNLILTYEFAP